MDRAILLGLGFDCRDNQKRITLGKNYRLYGGSRQTHRMMQEKCIKFNEQLQKKGKSIDNISIEEFYEIADRAGLKIPQKRF